MEPKAQSKSKFRRAQSASIGKWKRVLAQLERIQDLVQSNCGFCYEYGNYDGEFFRCSGELCPANKLCDGVGPIGDSLSSSFGLVLDLVKGIGELKGEKLKKEMNYGN